MYFVCTAGLAYIVGGKTEVLAKFGRDQAEAAMEKFDEAKGTRKYFIKLLQTGVNMLGETGDDKVKSVILYNGLYNFLESGANADETWAAIKAHEDA